MRLPTRGMQTIPALPDAFLRRPQPNYSGIPILSALSCMDLAGHLTCKPLFPPPSNAEYDNAGKSSRSHSLVPVVLILSLILLLLISLLVLLLVLLLILRLIFLRITYINQSANHCNPVEDFLSLVYVYSLQYNNTKRKRQQHLIQDYLGIIAFEFLLDSPKRE